MLPFCAPPTIGRAGDVEVRPLQAVGELRQEAGRGDRAAFAAGDVGEVGEVALELLGVFLADRHVPGAIVGALAGFFERIAPARRRC